MNITMKKKVYVIGHKNPDTDSIVSAIALADLHKKQGEDFYVAARAGKVNAQTEYILNRFGVPFPEFLPDLVPKVAYYMKPYRAVIDKSASLWEAVSKMEEMHLTVLPVVDSDGKYCSLLHYNAFARNILKLLDPKKMAAISTSIDLLISTLNAQVLLKFNSEKVAKTTILVASAQFESFKKMLDVHPPENVIVITGDREDVQEYCIEKGVRGIVITLGFVMSKPLQEKAAKRKVSVIVSPYDTSSSCMLVLQSMPVDSLYDTILATLRASDTLRKIKPILAKSPNRLLPVVDDNNTVIGVISENDLLHEPNVEVVLVDHNEFSQAIEGVENYKIIEVVDHHRLGSWTTKAPIMFVNKPVGATSTIVANMFREQTIPISREIASILLAGILSDTLILQSATTTPVDCETAEYLSNIANLDIQELGKSIIQAAGNLSGRTAEDVIHQDLKEYTEDGYKFSISQIEIGSTDEIMTRKEEFLEELHKVRSGKDLIFASLMATDTTRLTSILLVSAEDAFLQQLEIPRVENGIYKLKDIVSRKKQLMPLLTEQLARMS